MKLTEEQLDIVKDRASMVVKYRETYQEVYDHLLTSLENAPETDPNQAIDDILIQDFGGSKGLYQMEKTQEKLVRQQVRHKHSLYILDCLKFPSVLLTVILFGLTYYFISDVDTGKSLQQIIRMILYLPFVFVIGAALLSRFFAISKPSVKYSEIYNLSGFAYILYYVLTYLIKFAFRANPNNILANVLYSMAFVSLLLYTVAFFRLYKDEFRMSLI